MVAYSIPFHRKLSTDLRAYFDFDHLWNADPHGALKHSADFRAECDSRLSSAEVDDLSLTVYLQILFSGFPRSAEYGHILGFSSAYFRRLRERDDTNALIELTNYIFKSLALNYEGPDPLLKDRTLRLFVELHYQANVELHASRHSAAGYRDLPIALNRAFDGALDNLPETVVLTLLTSNYLDSLALWLDIYLPWDPRGGKLLILAIGSEFAAALRGWLEGRGVHDARIVPFDPPRKLDVCGNGFSLDFLWYIKVHAVDALVQRDAHVIYSDLDAYWIRNYFEVRKTIQKAAITDVVLSMTSDMPKGAVMLWTFTPCAGFFEVMPSAGSKAFTSRWRTMTEIMFDDQIALAEIFLRDNLQWIDEFESTLTASTIWVASDNLPARIGVIGMETALRVGPPDLSTIGGVTIWHPRWIVAPEAHADAIAHISAARETMPRPEN